ncbi:uncharacterized protein CC84DRAFT_1094566 [Paraphaeosphaeria sporulosa]|uniref:HMG box domain-containing protein n=1 Tax=Paraphaeosphaeria sporulosa TaxID=1460663 RepID=A0A177CCD8_9PLEO|nr:uncharacterized protein CC84DRAFT_1094566 [Paraphaeosphaeria sporulosa]OAG05303.1 hypothetical protein CC84DRAFT_1094566 [Paraphaeosphaeria sporulosa]
MLASRVLPPIHPRPSSPPLATFYNIPRRYARSNMQAIEHTPSHSLMDDVKPVRSLRKTKRSYECRSAPTSDPAQKADMELPSPASSNASLAHGNKRSAASRDVGNGVDSGELSDPENSRGTRSASSSPGEHVCLCQPEPKIPRPRNAFILYRQHHQHAIAAANPGLPNPDISKIIGEQWKAESDAVKKVWQDLAQEEKDRHHEQYPDYRYQPRRLGKPLNPAVAHTTVDKYRCPKCGGRSIKTPSPSSPYPSSADTPTLPPPRYSESLTPSVRLPSIMNSLSMDSPARRRGTSGPSGLSNIQIPSTVREDGYGYTPNTPDSKRRRFNPYPMSSNGGRRLDGAYYHHSRRDSLPPLQMRTTPPQTATMPQMRTPRDVGRGSVDLNLIVPSANDQSRSVEAMVMSVPYTVKIKVLGRITPPLKEPGPSSPAVQVRGSIIAVEGEDQAAVAELAAWLNDFLARDKEYAPRVAEPPKEPAGKVDVSFEDYFGLIQEWHGRSKEMVKYITTPVALSSPPIPSVKSPASASDTDKDETMKETTSNTTPPTSPAPSAKPVLILPSYQLRASDVYASRIPIQDVYSPMDHWQWMATLWRGTVGPDLTIYIKSADKESREGGKLVEVNEEVRCMTVVKEGGGEFREAALRRVGFEVGEWVRGLGGGKV